MKEHQSFDIDNKLDFDLIEFYIKNINFKDK